MHPSRPLSRGSLALCLAMAFGILVGLTPALAADSAVTITNFAFAPAETIVAVGDKVVFKNGDDTIHSVFADDGSFHSPALDTGDEFTVTFAKVGTFAYHCGLHPFMQGKIMVK
jgi:plastocyanin